MFKAGDRVQATKSGYGPNAGKTVTGTVQTDAYGDRDYITVKWDDGSTDRGYADTFRNLRKMSADFSSATCPYCSKKVSMSCGALGDHRVPGGLCDGAGRLVESLDHRGRAVFAAPVTMASTDSLKARIAAALGWSERDVNSLSLASLRELVRPVNPSLADEISRAIQSGSYIR